MIVPPVGPEKIPVISIHLIDLAMRGVSTGHKGLPMPEYDFLRGAVATLVLYISFVLVFVVDDRFSVLQPEMRKETVGVGVLIGNMRHPCAIGIDRAVGVVVDGTGMLIGIMLP